MAAISTLISQVIAGNIPPSGVKVPLTFNNLARTFIPQLVPPQDPWFSYHADKWIPRSGGPEEYADKRIALIIPGLLTQPDTIIHLGRYLSNLKIKETKRYDDVWCYHYDSYKSLATLASRLSEDLGPFLEKTKGVDVFAHSMSGLFCRDAISTTPGIYIKNVVSIGTPNGGIPLTVLEQYAAKQVGPLLGGMLQGAIKQLVPAIYDMDEKSEYLEALNSTLEDNHSDFKNSVHYYTISGSSPYGFSGDLGPQIQSIYHQIDSSLKTDGLISSKSVHFDSLSNESTTWKDNETQKAELLLNHMQLLGGPDGTHAQTLMTETLGRWIETWPMD